MIIILEQILPAFLIIMLGGLAERKKLLGRQAVVILNNFVFYFAFPPLLFVIMAEQPLSAILNFPYIAALSMSMIGTFVVVLLISMLFFKDSLATNSLRAQAAAFPNTGYIGLGIVLAMFGHKALLPMGVSLVICMFIFAVSVALIEADCFAGESTLQTVLGVAKNIAKNPVVVSPVVGVLYAASGFPLPAIAQTFCHQLGAAAAPCALFAIGLNLAAQEIRPHWGEVAFVNFFKLFAQPVATLFLMKIFHVAPLWAIVGVVGTSISTAATIFMLAKQYKIYEQDADAVIFYGAVLSIISITVFTLIAERMFPL